MRPIILSILLTVATPYDNFTCASWLVNCWLNTKWSKIPWHDITCCTRLRLSDLCASWLDALDSQHVVDRCWPSNKSWRTREIVVTHSYVCYESFTWFIHMCWIVECQQATRVRHDWLTVDNCTTQLCGDSFTRVLWLIHVRMTALIRGTHMNSYGTHMHTHLWIHMAHTWIHTYAYTWQHSYVAHKWIETTEHASIFICVPWIRAFIAHIPIPMAQVVYSYVCHIRVLSCLIDISYGVAMISRLLKTIGLFCKRAL